MLTLYTVRNPEGSFLMTAPMVVIEAMFRISRFATKRVERELNAGNASATYHFNGRETALGLLHHITISVAE